MLIAGDKTVIAGDKSGRTEIQAGKGELVDMCVELLEIGWSLSTMRQSDKWPW